MATWPKFISLLSYFTHSNIDVLKKTLEDESNIHIKRFKENKMRANPDTFQGIAIGKNSIAENLSFNIGGITLECDNTVKLLGVTIDSLLNFDSHIKNVCKKSSRQIIVLQRVGKHLKQFIIRLFFKI